MVADPLKNDADRYKPEDWENDPLETTASPERSANSRILGYREFKLEVQHRLTG